MDVAALGQLVADAVTVASVPMAADVALIPVDPGEQVQVTAYARRTGQPTPGRMISFAVALHVDPGTTSEDVAELTTVAYQAIAAQVDAAHADSIRMAILPLDEERFERAVHKATTFFRTGAS
ncbi:hypothetical protein [Amycolatopsis coloradensis]|uniref:hypothetical protein n=1 Tax=Amycolatopsis coloradensis TaxID=76021 RepID=UPI0011781E58|nr:hypothetical protein [Amycolatopsis coloradensis]